MKRFASTRSEKRASQPVPGRAQCSVGSIEDEGIRYGLTIQALIASTIAIAPTIVTTQSIVIRQARGSRPVRRSTGFLTRRSAACSAPCAIPRSSCDPRKGGRPERSIRGDRKSTRLNSSHLGISYAVFCLKKKKYIDNLNRIKNKLE